MSGDAPGPSDARHNLPPQPTTFVGREADVAAVRQRLLDGDVRLLTLVGPGGVGKTRLALEAARGLLVRPAAGAAGAFPDGVWFVSLQSLSDPALVLPGVAQALGVDSTGGGPVEERLREHLEPRSLLLVLDNFEHLLAAAPSVAALLDASPRLNVLATSREPLHVRAEHEFPVLPLPVPGPGVAALDGVREHAAVHLFVERARRVRPDFVLTDGNAGAVAELCRRLDGLPLAIELAAARLKALSPEALLARLDLRLPLLTGGPRDAPARQRTLRATIAWSYDLLPRSEQVLFRRLGVFAGGCPAEAVAAVGGAPAPRPSDGLLDGLTSLVDKSLLLRDEAPEAPEAPEAHPRFRLLETVRAFALEELERAGERPAAERAHARYFLEFAERAAPGPAAAGGWFDRLDRLDREHDNLRAALRWWVAAGDAGRALRLATALGWFWHHHYHYVEGRAGFERAFALDWSGPARNRRARADALVTAAHFAYWEGSWNRSPAMRAWCEEALALYRAEGDPAGIGDALWALATCLRLGGDLDGERALLEESVATIRRAGSPSRLNPHAFKCLAEATLLDGDVDTGRALYEECLRLSRACGDVGQATWAQWELGHIAASRGDVAVARAQYQAVLENHRRENHRWGMALTLGALGVLLSLDGAAGAAEATFRESLALFTEFPHRLEGLTIALLGLAVAAAGRGATERAARLAGAAAQARADPDLLARRSDNETFGTRFRWTTLRSLLERAQRRLGAADRGAAWVTAEREGAALSPEQAVAFALQAPAVTAPAPPVAPGGGRLSPREVEVLRLVAAGKTNREAAAALMVSEHTVARHLANASNKLGLSSRAALSAYAVRSGLA